MAHTYLVLRIHLVWATKHRQPWLDASWRPRLWAHTAAILQSRRGRLIAAGGVADHIHLYIEPPVAMPVSDVVREIKTHTSRWIHRTFPHRREFRWQQGFSAFSVNPADDARLRTYIRDQEIHHRETGFVDEYLTLLARHGFAPDPESALD